MTTGNQRQTSKVKDQTFSTRGHMLFGAAVMAGLVFGIGGWAASAQLSGAVIASGTVVVERHVKKVQHRDGGIVSAIPVQNGDDVQAGDVVLRLDDTQIRSELAIIDGQLVELTTRSARLVAERDGLENLKLPDDFFNTMSGASSVVSGEQRLFEENRKTRASHKEQLSLRIIQLEVEISGLEAQRDAKKGERDLIDKELEQVRALHVKKLTPISRVYSMEREAKRLRGEHGALIAQIARAHGQISEIKVQKIGIDQTMRSDSQREIRSIEVKVAELRERRAAAQDRLNRVVLRAPVSGVVHELAVHTIGGVITPAADVLVIVPQSDALIVEAKFSATDIDQVTPGNAARLLLSAFSSEKTQEISGRVIQVAADASKDERTGASYFTGRVAIAPGELKRLGDLKLVPGMPVEIFVSTGERTVISYLTKPILDQVNRSFRE